MVKSFKDLLVWQKSMKLVSDIYDVSHILPATEKYGLQSQITRCAVSIPSNIAEGYRRNNRREYVQFCGIALGSCAELETQLLIIQKNFVDIKVDQCLILAEEIQKMLYSLIIKLKKTEP